MAEEKALLSVLRRQVRSVPPLWLMRQAGRYLPEYRDVRATTKSFLDFCYSPQKAADVTLQPIRRFHFDAAILFSDILVVPDAMGQRVSFESGSGPRLEPIETPEQAQRLGAFKVEASFARVRDDRSCENRAAVGRGVHRLLRRAVARS